MTTENLTRNQKRAEQEVIHKIRGSFRHVLTAGANIGTTGNVSSKPLSSEDGQISLIDGVWQVNKGLLSKLPPVLEDSTYEQLVNGVPEDQRSMLTAALMAVTRATYGKNQVLTTPSDERLKSIAQHEFIETLRNIQETAQMDRVRAGMRRNKPAEGSTPTPYVQ